MLFKSLLTSVALASSALAASSGSSSAAAKSTASSSSSSSSSLPEIEIVGNKFFYSNNGSQFLFRGVAYQQSVVNTTGAFVDPLADAAACKRDVPYLQELGTNVIRVYAVNVSQDHSECMQLLADAGIYVIADLSQPDQSINRDTPEWTVDLLKRYTSVVDLLQGYSNVLGFFAGNEVTNEVSNTDASAFVKAAVRDTKAYIKLSNYRNIPVGYSANDDTDIRVSLADYFACGSEDERADFFGINMYEWCGKSTYTLSGYSTISQDYANLGIPIFFSEYGCNKVTPRLFQEVGTLYSSQMTNEWSGGIVYMYFQEENDYGLVTIDSSGDVSTLQDFANLKSQLASISPSLASAAGANASATVTSCPTATDNWEASTNLPPTPDQGVCDCMSQSLGCVVSSKVSSDDYSDLFSVVCGLVDCGGIGSNGTTGVYGAFSPCSDEDRLNYVLNLYYLAQGKSGSACDFSGSASTQSATTASSCSAILKSAGPSGLGTVSGSVQGGSATGGSGSAGSGSSKTGSSSKGSSSASSSSKKGGASPQASVGGFAKAVMVGSAFVFGLGLAVV